MNTSSKIYTLDQLKPVLDNWRKDGLKIVFTNGCFDIVHLGHIDYLEKARNKGDKLVLGLNTDNSVQRLKGESRPIVAEYPRARMMAALEFVDAVILFDEDTPLWLIQQVKPDILTKGDDYCVENIVGADFVIQHGGKVETIELVKGFSTSNIVEKIKKSI